MTVFPGEAHPFETTRPFGPIAEALAHRLSHVPVLLVGTLRTSPRPAEVDQLLDEVIGSGAAFVRLEPLAADQVEALATAELGLAPGPAMAQLLAKAGGNPLWVVELIRSLTAEGLVQQSGANAEVTTSELPDSLRELMLRRLRYLPQPTLELLQITSVIGDAVSIHDLSAVTRRPALALLAGLVEAFTARLLGESGDAVVFGHQLVHEAIYRDIPGPVRRGMHRDVAAALGRAGASLAQIASHLILGAAPGDVHAVRQLREAARDASARDPTATVELLRRARYLLPPGARRPGPARRRTGQRPAHSWPCGRGRTPSRGGPGTGPNPMPTCRCGQRSCRRSRCRTAHRS